MHNEHPVVPTRNEFYLNDLLPQPCFGLSSSNQVEPTIELIADMLIALLVARGDLALEMPPIAARQPTKIFAGTLSSLQLST